MGMVGNMNRKIILGFFLLILICISTASADQIVVKTVVYPEINPFNFNGTVMTNHDGVTYQTAGDGTVIINDGERCLAFGVIGNYDSVPYTFMSMDFTWDWTAEQNDEDWIFHATNNNSDFLWNQTWYFYHDFGTPMKIEHYLENNFDLSILETQMFYISTLNEDDIIGYEGSYYPVTNWIGVQPPLSVGEMGEDFNDNVPNVDFNNIFDFNFGDLIENNFTINQLYIGNAGVLGYPLIDIVGVGFTYDVGTFPSGTNVTIDPQIVAKPDTYAVSGQYDGLLTSENVYSTGFVPADISSSTAMTSTQYIALSIDDDNFVSSDGSITNDGFIYVNFSVSNIDNINWFDIEIVATGNRGWYMGAWNESDGKWYTMNNTAATIETTLTYNVTDTDIIKYSEVENGNTTFSIALWVDDGLSNDVDADLISVTFDYEVVTILPAIISNGNNKTDNDTLSITVNTYEVVNFNVTANQSIDTWNWSVDNVSQSHNFNNLTWNWPTPGNKTVKVNATNSNGTSSTLEWNVTALPNSTTAPNITLMSVTPDELEVDYTGLVTISYMVASDYPLDLSKLAFLHGVNYTVTEDMRTHITVPPNSIASEGIYRGSRRNITPYLTWEFNTDITEGNVWKWGGGDYNSNGISINAVNATHTWVNISGPMQSILPSSFYIGKKEMYNAPKTAFEINRAQGLIIKTWNLEMIRERDIYYYMNLYFDTSWEGILPTYPIEMGLCNYSYDPSTDDMDTSTNCVKIGEWDGNRWVNHTWNPGPNASFATPMIVSASQYTDPKLDEINYIWLRSNALTSSSFVLNATNYDPGVCNVSFSETETFWSYNEVNGITTPLAYTPSFFVLFTRDYEEMLHHLYIADNQGNWDHSDIFNIPIGMSTYPPSEVSFEHFHLVCECLELYEDEEMDATYDDNFTMTLHSPGDPDSATTSHNVTLHEYPSLDFVAVINDTIVTTGPEYFDVEFTTNPYYSSTQQYTLKCVSTDAEDNNATQWLDSHFTLDADGNQGWIYCDVDNHLTFWGIPDIPALYSIVSNSSLISYDSGIYTMHVPFFKSKNNDTLLFNETVHLESLNDSNVVYLRFTGRTLFDNATILGWNTTSNTPAPVTDTYRSYAFTYLTAFGNITNSNFSYLGCDEYRQEGVTFVGNHHNYKIDNTTFSHNYMGLVFENCANFNISQCSIHDNVEVGLGVYFTNDTVIENNMINSNGLQSISLYGSYNNIIGYNDITNSGTRGIHIWGDSANNTCTGDNISGSTQYDYYFTSAAVNNYIIDPVSTTNIIRSTAGCSVNIENSDNTAFSEDSMNTSYAYLTNFSMFVSPYGASQTFNITQHNVTIIPSTDKLSVWNIEWNENLAFNVSSDTGNNPTWFNVTNNSWANNNVTIYRNDTLYTEKIANSIGLVTFNYLDSYSEKYFEFKPNNLINITGGTNPTIDEGETLFVDFNHIDIDGDTPTFSCNDTSKFTDFNPVTGTGNWTPNYTESDVYYVDFGVSDGRGSFDNFTMMITVLDYGTPGVITNLVNNTDNFWAYWSWTGALNADSYNISIGSGYENGTINEFFNNTPLSPHDYSNISIQSYNSTTGQLSAAVADSLQLPNNPVTITNTSDPSVIVGVNIYINYDFIDLDSDTVVFSINGSNFTDFDSATGEGNWTPAIDDVGIHHFDVGVSDGYGSYDNYTMEITIITLLPPQNLENITDTDRIHFNWDDDASVAYWDIYQRIHTIPYTDVIIVLDGIKDAEFTDRGCTCVGYAPNPYTPFGLESITWLRNSTTLSGYADGEDNDGLPGDDLYEFMLDMTANGLTTDDRKFILSESGTVTVEYWAGSAWANYPAGTLAQGIVIGAGIPGTLQYEMQIPINELTNFSNGNTIRTAMSRIHTGSNPDIYSYYPSALQNDTDSSVWSEMNLTAESEYTHLNNVTDSTYSVMDLTSLTWYRHKFISINGSSESSPLYSNDITHATPFYNVSGYIKDNSGNPIVGADVWGQNGYVQDTDISNATGYYHGDHFHNGTFDIYANASGYEINYTNIIVNGADLTNVNVTLLLTGYEINDDGSITTWGFTNLNNLYGAINNESKISYDEINDIYTILVSILYNGDSTFSMTDNVIINPGVTFEINGPYLISDVSVNGSDLVINTTESGTISNVTFTDINLSFIDTVATLDSNSYSDNISVSNATLSISNDAFNSNSLIIDNNSTVTITDTDNISLSIQDVDSIVVVENTDGQVFTTTVQACGVGSSIQETITGSIQDLTIVQKEEYLTFVENTCFTVNDFSLLTFSNMTIVSGTTDTWNINGLTPGEIYLLFNTTGILKETQFADSNGSVTFTFDMNYLTSTYIVQSYTPTSLTPSVPELTAIGFTVNTVANSNHTWYKNGTPQYTNTSVSFSQYNISSAEEGIWNITVITEAIIGLPGSDNVTWILNVTPLYPDPVTNLVNTTYNFGMNWTFDAGANATFYNIWINDVEITNTTNLYYNHSTSPHNASTISIRSYSSTWDGYSGWTNQSTTIPNNPVSAIETIDDMPNERELFEITIDVNSSDLDNDVLIYGINRPNLFTDFNNLTGEGNWTPSSTEAGTYQIEVNVTDGYGSYDTKTFEIIVGEHLVLTNKNPLYNTEITMYGRQTYSITTSVSTTSTWTIDGHEEPSGDSDKDKIFTTPILEIGNYDIEFVAYSVYDSNINISEEWSLSVVAAPVTGGGSPSRSKPSVGAGTSNEPLDNVVCKESGAIRNLKAGEKISYIIKDNECLKVVDVSFIPTANSRDQPIYLETLKSRSVFVTEDVPNYKIHYFNLFVGLLGYDSKTEQEKITFKLKVSGIEEANLEPESMKLYKWSDEDKTWIRKYTELIDSDEDFYYYESDSGATTGYFAISGKEAIPEVMKIDKDIFGFLPGLGNFDSIIPDAIGKGIITPFFESIGVFINDIIAEFVPSAVPKEDTKIVGFTITAQQDTTGSSNSALIPITTSLFALIVTGLLAFYYNSDKWFISMFVAFLLLGSFYTVFGNEMIALFTIPLLNIIFNVIVISSISYLAPGTVDEIKGKNEPRGMNK